MTRILFVDDEPNILQGLQRMLRPLRREWEAEFVSSGQEALAAMERRPFDVIVSDMRMPGMSGVQLLDEMQLKYPGTARIILSGQAEKSQVLQLARSTHQYLAKPCDESSLKGAIRRSSAMLEGLRYSNIRQVVSQAQSLPSVPALYAQIVEAVQSNQVSLAKVADLIASDMAISAKILQVVNSAFFGAPKQLSSVTEAVTMLGIETIKGLVLTEGVFQVFENNEIEGLSIEELWRHSAKVASIARVLAKEECLAGEADDEAFTAGFLHDIGKLIFAIHLPDQYREIQDIIAKTQCPSWKVEYEVLGAAHPETGAYLLRLWGLPDSLVDAIAWHHQPAGRAAEGLDSAGLIHIAEALAHAITSKGAIKPTDLIDMDYLTSVGLADRVDGWLELVSK